MVGSSTPKIVAAPAATPPSKPGRVTVHLLLPGTTFVSDGSPVHASVVIDNKTGRSLVIKNFKCTVDGELRVGFSNTQVPFAPAFTDERCLRQASLKNGISQFDVNVDTSYQSCIERPAGDQAPHAVICPPSGGTPALPAGAYKTTIIWVGAPAGTVFPRPSAIVLRPPVSR